jgi:uncharacterized protein YabN with tetrapyrrole methylase and pyrophosphatase domain
MLKMADEGPRLQTLEDLLAVMARLRDPVAGCPWDVNQNFATIGPYTIEEAYEVADAFRWSITRRWLPSRSASILPTSSTRSHGK